MQIQKRHKNAKCETGKIVKDAKRGKRIRKPPKRGKSNCSKTKKFENDKYLNKKTNSKIKTIFTSIRLNIIIKTKLKIQIPTIIWDSNRVPFIHVQLANNYVNYVKIIIKSWVLPKTTISRKQINNSIPKT